MPLTDIPSGRLLLAFVLGVDSDISYRQMNLLLLTSSRYRFEMPL